jgi:penicillin amidase
LARTFHDELPEDDWPDGGDRWFEVVRLMWADQADPWWDDVSTPTRETRDDVVSAAVLDARTELTNRLAKDPERWEWGRLHQLELVHQTFGESGISILERLFNRGPLRLGGGDGLVDATASYAPDGYEVVWVPSMRMVVDLADLDRSTWVNLTGQSGHPYDRTYTDQAELWRDGKQVPWAWSPEAVDQAARDHLTMLPSPE